jgi:hypothetical protein
MYVRKRRNSPGGSAAVIDEAAVKVRNLNTVSKETW